MRLLDLEPIIEDNIEAGIATELISSPGRGKSEFVEGLVKKWSARDGFQWGYATCFLATMNPSDLMGYMVPKALPEGGLASVFTLPPWMLTRPTAEHPLGQPLSTFKRGILLLDEWGQGDGDTKKAAAQLLLKGEIGPHKLPPGWGVIAASNQKSDRSGVTKEFDFVINRRQEIIITDDMPSWQDWAARNGISPLTCAFAEQNPQVVFTDGVPDKQGPWTTPRSLVMVDRLMQRKAARNGGEFPSDPATVESITGIMGAGAAQYFAFMKLAQEMPKYDDIVKNPSDTKVPTKPDVQMLVCYDLAHRITDKDAGAVIEYIERFPKEFSVTFATTACKRRPMLAATPAFHKWCKANSNLMALITAR